MTPGSSREHPIVRPTARVLLLDPSDRTMLFTANTPDEETASRSGSLLAEVWNPERRTKRPPLAN
jgi:hypothetical protein